MKHSTLSEKLTVAQLVKTFPGSYWTRRFTAIFKRASHRTLSWARCTHSKPSYPI